MTLAETKPVTRPRLRHGLRAVFARMLLSQRASQRQLQQRNCLRSFPSPVPSWRNFMPQRSPRKDQEILVGKEIDFLNLVQADCLHPAGHLRFRNNEIL